MRTIARSVTAMALCVAMASPSFAGRLAAVGNPEGETGLASLSDVTEIMMSAASFRGAFGIPTSWIFEKVKPGEILATLHSRTHVAKVVITYDKSKYKITYKDSDNLNYDGKNIHPNYNKWVGELKRNIDLCFTQRRADIANAKAK